MAAATRFAMTAAIFFAVSCSSGGGIALNPDGSGQPGDAGPIATGDTRGPDATPALVVVQAQLLETTTGGCTVRGTPSDLRMTQGKLDLALDKDYPYELYPLIQNTLAAVGGGAAIGDPNGVTVTGFHVSIAPPAGAVSMPWSATCPGEYDYQRETLMLAPGDTAAAIVQAIRPCNASVLRKQLVAGAPGFDPSLGTEVIVRVTIRALGRQGSVEVESPAFIFPIRVCLGCLQTGYPDPVFADFEYPKVASCRDLGANPYLGNPCNPGQDQRILCCAPDVANPQAIECPGIPRATPTSTP